MDKHYWFLLLFPWVVAVSIVPAAQAQPWSGIISSRRAINWTNAGLPATYPDGETSPNPWTPPTRTTPCATIAPEGSPGSPVAPTDLNNAIQTCPHGEYVALEAGSYYYNANVCMASAAFPDAVNGITLRGAGADKTFIYFSGSAALQEGGCGSQYSASTSWTSGFAQGATSITVGSIGNFVAGQTILELQECGTGFSGASCSNATDSQVDNGAEWICGGDGPWCSHGGTGNEGGLYQTQEVLVTGLNESGPNTVTISPGLYMDNWSATLGPMVTYLYPPAYGLGLEDLSMDEEHSSGTNSLSFCYGCWVKLGLTGVKNYLIENNYFWDADSHDGYGITSSIGYGAGDGLILNNILDYQDAIAWDGGGEGTVAAYNYQGTSTAGSVGNDTYNIFQHTGGTSYLLYEANETSEIMDDNIHGTHDMSTLFRNRLTAKAQAYTYGNAAVFIGQGTRFTNVIGNVLGTAGFNGSYCCFGGEPIYDIGVGAVLDQQGVPFDALVKASSMLWGNYDTFNGALQWNPSEVPSALDEAVGYQQQIGTGDGATLTFTGTLANLPAISPNGMVYDRVDGLYAYDNGTGALTNDVTAGSINYTDGTVTVTFTAAPSNGAAVYVNYLQQTTTASPYQNTVPSSHSLPLSFFFTNLQPGTSGTNLPFGKVCTNYTTAGGCGGSYLDFPEPGIGPDVTGGNGPGGYSYEIPASDAWNSLPTDPSYQASYPITGSSWAGGIETLAVSGLSSAPSGEFDITGVSACNGTRIPITTSGSTTVSYALASNPGSCSGGSFKYPDVRQFNETVYGSGGSGSNPPAPVITSPVSVTGTVGNAFNYQITANNSPTSFNATGLPSWLSVNTNTGLISGTPPAAGTFNFTVLATNAGGDSGSASVVLTVADSADLASVRVYPNPWRSDKHLGKSITFDALALNSTVKIFTISGHCIKTLPTSSSSIAWDLTNDSGDRVASGIYIYLITDSQGDKVKGKVAVIK